MQPVFSEPARLGSQRFIVLYMLSGLGGAALSFLTPMAAIVGASGATFGVFLAFATGVAL